MSEYIDIGVNLTSKTFKKDLPAVIERATQAGVSQLIITGTDMEANEQAIELCEQWSGICSCTVGVHPHHASDFSSTMCSELLDMQKHTCVVAVGECGLDFNRNFSPRKEQINAFEAQIELSLETKKPLFLHQRDAHEDFMAVLNSAGSDLGQVVVHCFTGILQEAEEYIEAGFYIGVTGWICDERRGHDLQKAVSVIPLDKLMLETDAPYLMPRDLPDNYVYGQPVKKGRNEPCFLPHIAKRIAEYMEVDVEILQRQTLINTKTFFSL